MSPLTYDDWAEAIAAFFFDAAHAGDEVLFAIDDRSLSEVSGLPEAEAVQSLSSAVRSVVGIDWGVDLVARRAWRWRREGPIGPHPALPLLALTVLAASRMGGDRALAPHNYYVPLRHLLDPGDDEKGAPGTFTSYIELLWHDVARWVNDDQAGRHGRLVIRDTGYLRFVGLAVQHALVKSADLRHLDAFFRRIGLEPGEEVAPAELRRALAVWTASRDEPWARRLGRISTDDGLSTLCEALLEREARCWDGRSRDPRTGRPVGRIRVGIPSLRRPIPGLYVEWDERLPEAATMSLPDSGEVELVRWEGWYSPHPLADVDVAKALFDGFEFRANGLRFALRPDAVHALAYDDDLGAWVSVDSMSYGDRYQLLVWWQSRDEIIRFLEREAPDTWRLDERAVRFLPDGWHLITDVQINTRPSNTPPAAMAALIPAGPGPRLRLFGGLPITTMQGVYLRGGEPALALSTISEEDRISIERLETGEVEHFRVVNGEKREISLWKLQLEPGHYNVRHGESTVTLQIVDGIAEVAGPGAGSVAHAGRDNVQVVGTRVADSTPPSVPITIRAPRSSDATVVLGSRPENYAVVTLPAWLSTQVGFELTWRTIDAWVDFQPAWQLAADAAGNYQAFLLTELEPESTQDGSATKWGRMIIRATLVSDQPERAVELWDRYRAVAKGRQR